jgi:hypothetical protein
MSIRLRFGRAACFLLRRHDPVPLAPVTHIGLASGVGISSANEGLVCRRCYTILELDD